MSEHRRPGPSDQSDQASKASLPSAAPGELPLMLRRVAEAVQAHHAGGKLYGAIEADDVVHLQASVGWTLPPPPETIALDRFASDAPWYRSMTRQGVETLPGTIVAAQALLDQLSEPLNATTIDCFALGRLACRLFADCSVADYLRSPKAVARVPQAVRPFIDAALGFDKTRRAAHVEPLLDLLNINLQSPTSTSASTTVLDTDDERTGTSEVSASVEADVPFPTIGHFRLVRQIGHGGMGDVYEGYDDSLKRRVALKILPAELGRQESFVQRFYSEAASVAKIVHPNIVQIFFIGRDRGHHFFAMEFVDGRSLADELAGHQSLPVPAAIGIIEQVLKGLSAAHAKGLVHRDVKPGNILIEEATTRCLLADFGLVKSISEESGPTHSGTVLGTMDYVSPEQGRGQAVDARSDLYSLGVVLYEMLRGQLPFTADSPTGMIFQHVYEHPEPLHTTAPQVPLEVSAIVAKMMAKNPAQRFPNAEAVLGDLAAFSQGLPLPSGADLAFRNDPDTFARTISEAIAQQPASVIIRAPNFEELDLELEVVKSAAATKWGKWLERWHDWLEAKSPAIAERLQSTQLQIDRAIQKLERHRDQLVMLDRDARIILKQLQQQVVACQQVSTEEAQKSGAAPMAELQQAVTEQQQQVDEIHTRLSKINVQLAQVRSERDVLVARLRAAEAKRRMHVGEKPSPRLIWKLFALIAVVMLAWLGWNIVPAIWHTRAGASSAVDSAAAATPDSRQWPASGQPEILIPLESNLKVMTVRTTNYNGRHNYTLLASLENDAVLKFTYRKELDHIYETRFPAAPKDVRALALSPAGTYAAFALGDNSIRIFKTATSTADEYRRLEGHLSPASSLIFSDDESTLVSASNDQTLRFWDLQTGSEQQRYDFPQSSSPMLAANHALTRFLLGSRHRGGKVPARVWDLVGERQAATFPLDSAVSSVSLSSDAETAYAFADGRVYVWTAMTGQKLREFGSPSAIGAIAGEAQRAVTLSDGQLQLWDTESGKQTEATSVAIAPNLQTQLVLAETGEAAFAVTSDKQLHVLNLPAVPPPDGLLHTFSESSPVHALDVSSDGVWAAGGGEGTIYVWNLERPSTSYTLDTGDVVSTVRFSPHMDYLAFGTGQKNTPNNYVGIREITSDNIQRFLTRKENWRTLKDFRQPITGLAWDSYGGRLFASSKDGSLKIWDPAGDRVQAAVELPEPIQQFVNLNNRETSVLITGVHTLADWQWGVPNTSPALEAISATALAVSAPSGEWIAVGDSAGNIIVSDSQSRQSVANLANDRDAVTALAFVPSTKRLVSGHASGQINVWDFAKSRRRKSFPGRGRAITSLAVTPNGRYVVAASLSGTVNVWQLP